MRANVLGRAALALALVACDATLLVAQSAPASADSSAAVLAPLDQLAGTTWLAQGNGFRTELSYRWLVPGSVLGASNRVTRPDGSLIARYEGSYAWDAGLGKLVFWNASTGGEVHRGSAWWSNGVLWHQAEVSGGQLSSYVSAVRQADNRLQFFAAWGATEATPAVLQEEPLEYSIVASGDRNSSSSAASLTLPDGNNLLAPLSFMSGCWRGETANDVVLEEQYSAADGNLMVGTSRYIRAGRVVQFEFSRISVDSGVVSLLPYPGGSPSEHSFRMTRAADGSALFEAPDHDFPRRIWYSLAGPDSLEARLDGGEGSQRTIFWKMARVACAGTR